MTDAQWLQLVAAIQARHAHARPHAERELRLVLEVGGTRVPLRVLRTDDDDALVLVELASRDTLDLASALRCNGALRAGRISLLGDRLVLDARLPPGLAADELERRLQAVTHEVVAIRRATNQATNDAPPSTGAFAYAL